MIKMEEGLANFIVEGQNQYYVSSVRQPIKGSLIIHCNSIRFYLPCI